MDNRSLLIQGDRPLDPPDDAAWAAWAQPFGLSPYVAKASYVIGVSREMVLSAGALFEKKYYLGALFMALDATELIGRCVGGFRDSKYEATMRLTEGLRYLEKIDSTPKLLPHSVEDYVALRNFVAHGAASSQSGVSFARETIRALMVLVTKALNDMWADNTAMDKFAKCEIQPLSTDVAGNHEAVFIRDVQDMLANGKKPGDEIPQWVTAHLDLTSPAPTGTGSPTGGSVT
jgi:hypothetical protein